jgi:DNA-binding beta-propeller fold protein YncE
MSTLGKDVTVRYFTVVALALLAAAGTARADWVIGRIPFSYGPAGMAIDPVANMVVLANYTSNTITTITAGGGMGTGPCPSGPNAVAVDPSRGRAYVTTWNADTLVVMDSTGVTYAPTGSGPCCVAVNPVTNRVYVGNWNSSLVTVVDSDSRKRPRSHRREPGHQQDLSG